MEKEIIKEINELRGNPSEYVQKLIKNKQYFQNGGKNWKHPDFKASIKTEEGPAAYDEAIDFLKSHSASLEHLTPSKGLNKIALEFLRKFQKDANEEVELGPIVEKHGDFTGAFRRLAEFGSHTAELIVVNLLVCDGDKSRVYREALLSDKLKKIGVAHGKHDLYNKCTVIVACTTFKNKFDPDDSVH